MSTEGERNWSAVISIATEHAGLRPHFKRLEDALYGALSELDDANQVVAFITVLRAHLAERRQTLHRLRSLNRNRKSGRLW